MPAAVAGNLPDGIMDIDDSHRLVIGRYPLPPPPVNGRQMAYPIVFHPAGSAVAQAMTIDLKFGDDRSNVDLALVPVPAARVSGIVEGPPEGVGAVDAATVARRDGAHRLRRRGRDRVGRCRRPVHFLSRAGRQLHDLMHL
jgi:hypothetical protein